MNRIFNLALLSLLIVSCNQSNTQLVLNGSMLSTDDDLYIYDFVTGLPIDTILVNNGAFTYTHEIVGAPQLVGLSNNRGLSHSLFLEKGLLSLQTDTGRILGTPLNDHLAEFSMSYRGVFDDFREKIAVVRSKLKKGEEPSEELSEEMQDVLKEMDALLAETIKQYYDKDKETAVGAFELLSLDELVSDEEYLALYEQGGSFVKNFEPVVKRVEMITQRTKTSVGAMYLDLEGVNPKDESQVLKLSDFVGKGKYVLLDFWASWCGPCRATMPTIKKLNDAYSSKGLDVLGIVMSDEIEAHLAAAKELEVSWSQLFDAKNESNDLYGVQTIPTLILLDKDGTILVRTHEKEEIVMKIENLLGK